MGVVGEPCLSITVPASTPVRFVGRRDSEDAPPHYGSPMSLADLCEQQKPIQGDVLQVCQSPASVEKGDGLHLACFEWGLNELFSVHLVKLWVRRARLPP